MQNNVEEGEAAKDRDPIVSRGFWGVERTGGIGEGVGRGVGRGVGHRGERRLDAGGRRRRKREEEGGRGRKREEERGGVKKGMNEDGD